MIYWPMQPFNCSDTYTTIRHTVRIVPRTFPKTKHGNEKYFFTLSFGFIPSHKTINCRLLLSASMKKNILCLSKEHHFNIDQLIVHNF